MEEPQAAPNHEEYWTEMTHTPKPTPPIRRVLPTSTGTTLEWIPRRDGGLDLGVGGHIEVALTAEEFEWFLDDLKGLRPPGPVYRNGPPEPFLRPNEVKSSDG